jgi:hypothetical protein
MAHCCAGKLGGDTYSLVLDLLGLAALEGGAMTLVLQALGSDQPLDLGRLCVGLLALTLGLDLSSNDVLADLLIRKFQVSSSHGGFNIVFGTSRVAFASSSSRTYLSQSLSQIYPCIRACGISMRVEKEG